MPGLGGDGADESVGVSVVLEPVVDARAARVEVERQAHAVVARAGLRRKVAVVALLGDVAVPCTRTNKRMEQRKCW